MDVSTELNVLHPLLNAHDLQLQPFVWFGVNTFLLYLFAAAGLSDVFACSPALRCCPSCWC